jgi:hypothetical protein
MLSFELRKYVDGRWVLDTIFDDKTEAVAEAKSLMTRSRSLAAVRVMAVQDDESGFKEWTVYKQTMVDESNEQANQRAIQNRRDAHSARSPRNGGSSQAKGQKKKAQSSWVYYAGLMARVVVIIGAGAGAIFLIHRQFL